MTDLAALRSHLSAQRAHVLGILAGLDDDDAWHVPPGTRPDDLRGLYERECMLAHRALDDAQSDAAPGWWPDNMTRWRAPTVEEVVLHVITETACHAGHLDAARELLDGRQWLVWVG